MEHKLRLGERLEPDEMRLVLMDRKWQEYAMALPIVRAYLGLPEAVDRARSGLTWLVATIRRLRAGRLSFSNGTLQISWGEPDD